MDNPDWDEYFLDQIPGIAKKSKDPSTKVGAIITGQDHGTRATGFNGFPRGVLEDISKFPERFERPEKYEWIVHAERNAIYYAAKVGVPLDGCIVYVDWLPCCECARAIIQSGIKKVVIDADSASSNSEELKKRWAIDQARGTKMFEEAGVELIRYTRKK